MKKPTNILQSIVHTFKNLSLWGKVLLYVLIFLIVVSWTKGLTRPPREGFTQAESFIEKTGTDMYDDFYVDIYDFLVFSKAKNNYEVEEIVDKTNVTTESNILDIGSGTGHHVGELLAKGIQATGVDISQAMVEKAKENFPGGNFVQGDIRNEKQFPSSSFTHILCMYFTLYYIQDKPALFRNCFKWLKPGSYFIVHMVDREMFDPILPPGNPMIMVSPQKYAKERITSTQVVFNDFHYSSNFELDSNSNKAFFHEKFKNKKDDKVRKNEHVFYMETEDAITAMIQNAGFILDGRINLMKVHYEYQFLYVFQKPN